MLGVGHRQCTNNILANSVQLALYTTAYNLLCDIRYCKGYVVHFIKYIVIYRPGSLECHPFKLILYTEIDITDCSGEHLERERERGGEGGGARGFIILIL